MAIKASPRYHFESGTFGGSVGWGGGGWLGDTLHGRGGRQDEVGGLFNVSLGVGGVSVLPERPRLPELVSVALPTPPPYVPPPIIGPAESPVQEGVPVSWSDWIGLGNALPDDWNNYPMASDYPGIVAAGEGLVGDDDEVSILGDIYDTVDTALGGILPGGVPFGGPQQPVYSAGLSGMAPAVNPVLVPPPGTTVAVPQYQAAGCDNDPMRGMVYKKVCGQYRWVKQKRRRRRSLATNGDIVALSKLKGVLGNGKALDTWIAVNR